MGTVDVTRWPSARRRPLSIVWFAGMAGGWIVFLALLAFSEPSLGELWRTVRDLPLLIEGLVWLAFFPFVLALGIWESAWAEWLRFLLVACCAVAWSLSAWPRRR